MRFDLWTRENVYTAIACLSTFVIGWDEYANIFDILQRMETSDIILLCSGTLGPLLPRIQHPYPVRRGPKFPSAKHLLRYKSTDNI